MPDGPSSPSSSVGSDLGFDRGDDAGWPRFSVQYLMEPSTSSTPLVPLGTCLAIRNSGPDAVTQVLVDPNDSNLAPRTASRLGTRQLLGLCAIDDVKAYAATRMVFIDWVDRRGRLSTTWLRLPPVPRGISALLDGRRSR